MKLIAVRDFALVPALEPYISSEAGRDEKGNEVVNSDLKDKPGLGQFKHHRNIHKGFVFEIGKADKLAQLTRPERELVSQLAYCNCIGDANSPEVLKLVKADIAADVAAAKRDAELNAKASGQVATEALLALIAKLQPKSA